jgi:hypothetical protein
VGGIIWAKIWRVNTMSEADTGHEQVKGSGGMGRIDQKQNQ